VAPDLVIKGGAIAAAQMGDPNASIPTPQRIHYRPMFGALGRARTETSLTFVSDAAIEGGLARKLKVQKSLVAVENTQRPVQEEPHPQRREPEDHNRPGDQCHHRRRRAARLRAGGQAADGVEVLFVLRADCHPRESGDPARRLWRRRGFPHARE